MVSGRGVRERRLEGCLHGPPAVQCAQTLGVDWRGLQIGSGLANQHNGGNEQKACDKGWKWVKLGENPKMPHPQCGRSHKTCCQTTMVPRVSQKYGFLVRPDAQVVTLRLSPPPRLRRAAGNSPRLFVWSSPLSLAGAEPATEEGVGGDGVHVLGQSVLALLAENIWFGVTPLQLSAQGPEVGSCRVALEERGGGGLERKSLGTKNGANQYFLV